MAAYKGYEIIKTSESEAYLVKDEERLAHINCIGEISEQDKMEFIDSFQKMNK